MRHGAPPSATSPRRSSPSACASASSSSRGWPAFLRRRHVKLGVDPAEGRVPVVRRLGWHAASSSVILPGVTPAHRFFWAHPTHGREAPHESLAAAEHCGGGRFAHASNNEGRRPSLTLESCKGATHVWPPATGTMARRRPGIPRLFAVSSSTRANVALASTERSRSTSGRRLMGR